MKLLDDSSLYTNGLDFLDKIVILDQMYIFSNTTCFSISPHIYSKLRNLPNTDVRNYSIDFR